MRGQRNTWRIDVVEGLKAAELIWSDLEDKAKNRNGWKAFVHGLLSGGGATNID